MGATTERPLSIDASGNVHPASVAGLPVNLPAGTTLAGAAIVTGTGLPSQTGNSGKYLTTNGTAASWATIDLSSYQTKAGVLALGGFSSITGRVGNANLPLGAQLYDNAGTPIIAADFGARKFYTPAGLEAIAFDDLDYVEFYGDPHYSISSSGYATFEKVSIWDESAFFDNTGFHGDGSGLSNLDPLNLNVSTAVLGLLRKDSPSAISFIRINADNSVDWRTPAQTLSDIGAVPLNGALGTPSSGSAANLTSFPTLNQDTTGSAAKLSISGQTGLLTITGLTSTNRIKTVRDAADTILELGGSYTPTGTWTNMTLVTPALGTPASGVVTNLTGTASININGTVGATTPAAGSFTTLSSTGAYTNTKSGAASVSAGTYSGVPFAGTGTTSFPLLYLNDSTATASTTLSTSGTYLGVNGHGSADLLNLLLDGTSKFKVTSGGALTTAGSVNAIGGIAVSGNFAVDTSGQFKSSGPGDTVIDTQGAVFGRRGTSAKTTNYTVTSANSGTFFTNAGASGTVNFTLPTAAAGLYYTFYVDAAQTLTITAGASTTIQLAGSTSASAGNVTTNTVGNCITLVGISTTKWVAQSHEGTWTVN